MALEVAQLMSRITSHAQTTGLFDYVTGHEPKSQPGNGLICAVWLNRVDSIRASGLGQTSARIEFSVRLYSGMVQEPQDEIDPNLLAATDALFSNYIGDFELGGKARMIDVRGAHGEPLSAESGYINQDNKIYRVFTLTVPVIVNDVWEETP